MTTTTTTQRRARRTHLLHGRDERELARRLERFRDALRAREGSILRIDWEVGSHRAAVLYQIPLPDALSGG